ncbi:manganese/zinc/iron transport system permease protein [Nonlabens dokdonensis]|uniref:Metal ABC transporter, ABC-3 family n=2 Tax=Nonlabens dokdonensis TaxID=328515 RepID=L7WD47_NONDD|nr:metal ABC transporter, ABC-3 family [Nonlabens dokdonensis DSW-6]PZX44438.1 manganese/zinc/iron transport system permease protein [Nonlabens dokdonensis]
MNSELAIILIACLTSVACAIPGVFLVLRKMALISDAISHSILPGIVIGFFITEDLASPWLILLAAFSGIITVVLVEAIQKTGLVKEDTAIGLVFPALFSIGVLLIAIYANDIHLDTDAVLVGRLEYAAFDKLMIDGVSYGAKSLWTISAVLLLTIILLFAFYKELKLSTFDIGLSSALGFSPVIMHYGLMSVASVTTVVSFDAVGAILVVALMIAPAAAAYLLTTDLKKMILLSVLFGILSALGGYYFAAWLDASISGSITTVLGLIFLLVYLFAPSKGLIAVLFKQKRQRIEVSLLTFLLHLNNHDSKEERRVAHLQEHINWGKVRAQTVLELAEKNNMILIQNQVVSLTQKGLDFTEKALDYIITNKDEKIEDMKDDFFLFRG